MHAALHPAPRVALVGERSPTDGDIPQLAALMYSSYRGTIDDEGDSPESALLEIRRTFDGAYGELLREHSKVVDREGRLVHSTIITRWQQRPFVAFSMTAPTAKRNGLARTCLINAMQDLRAAGECELRLVVTLANLPALRLYERLGFVLEQ